MRYLGKTWEIKRIDEIRIKDLSIKSLWEYIEQRQKYLRRDSPS